MGSENYNLQVTLAKAENSQAFQTQYLFLDRALAGEAAERTAAEARKTQEQVASTHEPENREVEPDGQRARVIQRRRQKKKKRKDDPPGERPAQGHGRPSGPNGEGSLIDVLA